MELKKWMKDNRWTVVAMAKRLGISATMLHYILSGKRRPGVELAKGIQRVTEGEVKASDLLGLEA